MAEQLSPHAAHLTLPKVSRNKSTPTTLDPTTVPTSTTLATPAATPTTTATTPNGYTSQYVQNKQGDGSEASSTQLPMITPTSTDKQFVSGARPIPVTSPKQKRKPPKQLRLQPKPTQKQTEFCHYQPPPQPLPPSKRDQFFGILGALDPHRATPKEFIQLLVEAAVRDEEIARSIFRLNQERIQNPDLWRPPVPPGFVPQLPPHSSYPPRAPNTWLHVQPTPGSAPTGASDGALATPATLTSPLRKRKRGDIDKTATSRVIAHVPQMVMYWGPQQPPPPEGQAEFRNPLLNAHTPSQRDLMSEIPAKPLRRERNGRGKRGLATELSAISSDQPVDPVEPKSPSTNACLPCDYAWALDHAEAHLGFISDDNKAQEINQTDDEGNVALKLQKILRDLDSALDKHEELADRVHILTVMREIMAATIEADSKVGQECRESSHELDNIYLTAVQKLTPAQLRELKTLENGEWLEEMKGLVDDAAKVSSFQLIKQAYDHINNAD